MDDAFNPKCQKCQDGTGIAKSVRTTDIPDKLEVDVVCAHCGQTWTIERRSEPLALFTYASTTELKVL